MLIAENRNAADKEQERKTVTEINKEEKRPLIILTGPTAAGKTRLSIALARAVGGEVISADSMQVYRGMDIGSAKISRKEMEGIPHHLIDVLDPREEFNVVRFQSMAVEAMERIYGRGHIPLVVGGTGFYIQALLYGIDFSQPEEEGEAGDYRKRLEALAEEKGNQYLYDLLNEKDPEYAAENHPNNQKRVIRALEYIYLTGRTFSSYNHEQRKKESPYRFAYFVLTMDRARLYERINLRVDQMIDGGLLEEVKKLRAMGCKKGMTSMQGLGYKEMLDYLEGKLTFEQAAELLKRDTRRFAKRQLTWFRRERDVIWLEREQYAGQKELLKEMLERIELRCGIH